MVDRNHGGKNKVEANDRERSTDKKLSTRVSDSLTFKFPDFISAKTIGKSDVQVEIECTQENSFMNENLFVELFYFLSIAHHSCLLQSKKVIKITLKTHRLNWASFSETVVSAHNVP